MIYVHYFEISNEQAKNMSTVSLIDSSYRYGFHMTKYDSMIRTVKEVIDKTSLSAMQIYISNSRSKIPPKFDFTDLNRAREMIEKHQEIYVVIHGCLLYNLAGTVEGESDEKYEKSLSDTLQGLVAELDFGVALGRPNGVGVGVVVHPGSRKDKDAGHAKVSESIVNVLTRRTRESVKLAEIFGVTSEEICKRRKIILENSAGEGTKLCSTLEEIAGVINGVPKELRNQVKVCIDTAHGFGCGLYDWGKSGEIEKFYEDFDRIIGLEHLEVFHLNDSMIGNGDKRRDAPFGSKRDRHENLGFGYIFGTNERLRELHTFVKLAKYYGVPMIGEPPGPGLSDWMLICGLTKNDEDPLATNTIGFTV